MKNLELTNWDKSKIQFGLFCAHQKSHPNDKLLTALSDDVSKLDDLKLKLVEQFKMILIAKLGLVYFVKTQYE